MQKVESRAGATVGVQHDCEVGLATVGKLWPPMIRSPDRLEHRTVERGAQNLPEVYRKCVAYNKDRAGAGTRVGLNRFSRNRPCSWRLSEAGCASVTI
jgi:hypothetical protein